MISQKLVKLGTNFATKHDDTPEKESLLDNITWPKFDLTDGNLDDYTNWLNYTISQDMMRKTTSFTNICLIV